MESSVPKSRFCFLRSFLEACRKEPDQALLERLGGSLAKNLRIAISCGEKAHHTIMHDLAANFVGQGSNEGSARLILTDKDAL